MRDGTEKYIIRESTDKGMFFMCECGNVQYRTCADPRLLNGTLCPKQFWKGRYVTMYLDEDWFTEWERKEE